MMKMMTGKIVERMRKERERRKRDGREGRERFDTLICKVSTTPTKKYMDFVFLNSPNMMMTRVIPTYSSLRLH
jgi:hypothetical protein